MCSQTSLPPSALSRSRERHGSVHASLVLSTFFSKNKQKKSEVWKQFESNPKGIVSIRTFANCSTQSKIAILLIEGALWLLSHEKSSSATLCNTSALISSHRVWAAI